MLSNTATPKYYGAWREKVLRGEIPVNEEISLQMNIIDGRIKNPNIWYDDAAVEGWIKFCENELTTVDGADLEVLETFKLWGEDLFGWYFFIERSVYERNPDGIGGHYVNKRIKRRLINKQMIILGRGGAKTMYAEFVQAYGLIIDTSTTDQITTAPTMRQSEEVLNPLRTAIVRAKGPLFKFLTEGSLQNTTGNVAYRKKLTSTKKGIENFFTNSILRVVPMSIDKLQGLRCKYATIDEWLSCDIKEDPFIAIQQSASKIPDWVIVGTSSEGTIRNAIGDTIKMELMSILRGEYNDPHTSVWYYKLDSLEEINYPEMWVKANPNLDYTVSYDIYQQEVEKAENVPSARNEILAKRFGIPTEGYTYFFTYEETIPHPKREYWEMPCALGMDLSQGDDFCSFSFLFPLSNERFGIKTRNYISERTLMQLPAAMRLKYNDFLDEGSLCVMPGTVLDMMDVYDDIDRFIIDNEYDVRCVGYDPYNAKEFIQRYITENSAFGVEKVIQGSRTESVPLGELKALAHDRKLLFDEAIMEFAMGNCISLEDTNGNRKLYKRRHEGKIDCVAATMDAFISWKLNRDAFE